MRKGTSMLWLLLPVAACSGAGAVSPASPPEMERAVMTSVVSAVTPPAGLLPADWSRKDVGAEVGCGFTHRGDQSRSLELAVTDVRREAARDGAAALWRGRPHRSRCTSMATSIAPMSRVKARVKERTTRRGSTPEASYRPWNSPHRVTDPSMRSRWWPATAIRSGTATSTTGMARLRPRGTRGPRPRHADRATGKPDTTLAYE